MHTKKNAGVSTVIGTALLIALSVVLISVVSLSVISGVGSFETFEHKVVGFTVEVNDTYGNAVVMPVSGKDLPYLQSYTVYTDTGTSFSSDCDPCKVYRFNENVTYVNIVGNFSDGITALVFSGRVTNDNTTNESISTGDTTTPVEVGGDPGFIYNPNGYTSLHALATDINNWYHAYYTTDEDATTLRPGKGGGGNDNGQNGEANFVFTNSRPIVIAESPIEISTVKIHTLDVHDGSGLHIRIYDNGNFIRAPGYTGSLFIFGYVDKFDRKGIDIFKGDFVIDGDGQNTSASEPAVVIAYGAPVSISTNGKLTIKNNVNTDGNGGGIYIEEGGSLENSGELTVTGNSAKYGGGIYINGGTIQGSTAGVTGNTATEGDNIYTVTSP